MIDLPHELTSSDYAGAGEAQDKVLTRLNRHAIDVVEAVVRDFGLPVGYFHRSGKINAAASAVGEQANRSYAEHLAAMGEPHEMLDAQAMRQITGSSYYHGGLFTPGTAMLQPAGYIRRFAAGLERQGVKIFEGTPVTGFEATGTGWRLTTPKGRIAPTKVILADNGHLESFGFKAGRLMLIMLNACMTAEIPPEALRELGDREIWGAMVIYDLSDGPYKDDREGFERNACPLGKDAKAQSAGDIAKFKPTMNARGTSGTFSASPLLYYHLSRFFGADIGVPVAVWRSMDKDLHLSEVAHPGLAQSGHSHSSDMNAAGWRTLVAADADPSAYVPTSDLFTRDMNAVYGVLLKSKGDRYNSEVNGTRASGWGKGQNLDFQETAPFLALRSPAPMDKAIAEGVAGAIKDKQILKDMGADVPPAQIAYWMSDIANIVLLDFMLSQQDRVGNIDCVPHWYWVENGEVKSRKAVSHGDEKDPLPEGAIRIKRTHLNDNDAGGRVEYANFAKSTGMLEKLRHFPVGTYRQLMALDADLQAQGPLHAYLRDSFGLSGAQFDQLVVNTALAAQILRASCERGELRLDLDPQAFLLSGSVEEADIACRGRG